MPIAGETLYCRAQESDRCMDGWPLDEAYVDGPIEDDATWDGASVICDECFLVVGGYED